MKMELTVRQSRTSGFTTRSPVGPQQLDRSDHQRHQTFAPTEYAIGLATDPERETIYRARHEVYARELGQHAVNGTDRLRDSLDDRNIYLTAYAGQSVEDHLLTSPATGDIAGFVSITPPKAGCY